MVILCIRMILHLKADTFCTYNHILYENISGPLCSQKSLFYFKILKDYPQVFAVLLLLTLKLN